MSGAPLFETDPENIRPFPITDPDSTDDPTWYLHTARVGRALTWNVAAGRSTILKLLKDPPPLSQQKKKHSSSPITHSVYTKNYINTPHKRVNCHSDSGCWWDTYFQIGCNLCQHISVNSWNFHNFKAICLITWHEVQFHSNPIKGHGKEDFIFRQKKIWLLQEKELALLLLLEHLL